MLVFFTVSKAGVQLNNIFIFIHVKLIIKNNISVLGFGFLSHSRSLFQTRLYLTHPWGRTSCIHAVVCVKIF